MVHSSAKTNDDDRAICVSGFILFEEFTVFVLKDEELSLPKLFRVQSYTLRKLFSDVIAAVISRRLAI